MFFKLAWRNLWRNRRRSLITMGSIFFAVVLSTLMMSMKEGTYTNMIKSMIGAYVGYIQIQDTAYADNKKLDYAFDYSDSLKFLLNDHPLINAYTPRLESFALAASEVVTKGVLVVGVDPVKEQAVNQLKDRVSDGDYLLPKDNGVLLGSGLADYIQVGVGDTIVLLGQGYQGVNAVGKYPVRGLVKFGSPELSKQLVFLSLFEAQYLYNTEGMVTHIVLDPESKEKTDRIAQQVKSDIPRQYAVLPWEEITPDLKNMIETDRVEGYVFMFILYMVIAFGILGTIIMMLTERKYEFGILVGIGMKRWTLALTIWMEIILISVAGVLVGILGAIPVCAYFYWKPIRFGADLGKMMEDYGMEAVLQSSIEPGIFIQQAIVVAIISMIIALYPFLKLLRMRAIEYLQS